MVDFGVSTTFEKLVIWDRTDCCAGRIAGFQVYVSAVPDFATATSNPACFNPYADITDSSATIDLTQTPNGQCTAGRYLWITLPGDNRILTLCEVEVFQRRPWVWRQLSGLHEVAQGKKAVQSSTELCCGGGDASRAVDGDTSNNDYNRGSCSHTLTNTNQELDAAWRRV